MVVGRCAYNAGPCLACKLGPKKFTLDVVGTKADGVNRVANIEALLENIIVLIYNI